MKNYIDLTANDLFMIFSLRKSHTLVMLPSGVYIVYICKENSNKHDDMSKWPSIYVVKYKKKQKSLKSFIFAELSLRVVPTETNNKSNGCVVLLAGTVTPQEPSTRNWSAFYIQKIFICPTLPLHQSPPALTRFSTNQSFYLHNEHQLLWSSNQDLWEWEKYLRNVERGNRASQIMSSVQFLSPETWAWLAVILEQSVEENISGGVKYI